PLMPQRLTASFAICCDALGYAVPPLRGSEPGPPQSATARFTADATGILLVRGRGRGLRSRPCDRSACLNGDVVTVRFLPPGARGRSSPVSARRSPVWH